MTGDPLANIALLAVSIALLWFGAEWVVHSASRIARRFQLSELIIGATVVALGTSSPEICVTLVAALGGQPDISVGNVVGSNIFNVGLILGSCAVIWTIPTSRQLVYRDTVALIGASALLLGFLRDEKLGSGEGLAMMVLLCLYIWYLVRRGRGQIPAREEIPTGLATRRDYVFLVIGLAAIVGGAYLLVETASDLARKVGISEWTIGITIVAGGTSLPELATAIVAGRHGRTAMMAGMLIGSDLFNLLGVLGLAAFLRPLQIAEAATTGVLMMAGMLVILILFMRSDWRLTRTEGVLLLVLAVLRWGVPDFWS